MKCQTLQGKSFPTLHLHGDGGEGGVVVQVPKNNFLLGIT